jgi:hypothetical protein
MREKQRASYVEKVRCQFAYYTSSLGERARHINSSNFVCREGIDRFVGHLVQQGLMYPLSDAHANRQRSKGGSKGDGLRWPDTMNVSQEMHRFGLPVENAENLAILDLMVFASIIARQFD